MPKVKKKYGGNPLLVAKGLKMASESKMGQETLGKAGDFVKDIYNVYTSNIVRGKPCLEARIESNPIKMPYPPDPL